jgi:hypothetical protein
MGRAGGTNSGWRNLYATCWADAVLPIIKQAAKTTNKTSQSFIARRSLSGAIRATQIMMRDKRRRDLAWKWEGFWRETLGNRGGSVAWCTALLMLSSGQFR